MYEGHISECSDEPLRTKTKEAKNLLTFRTDQATSLTSYRLICASNVKKKVEKEIWDRKAPKRARRSIVQTCPSLKYLFLLLHPSDFVEIRSHSVYLVALLLEKYRTSFHCRLLFCKAGDHSHWRGPHMYNPLRDVTIACRQSSEKHGCCAALPGVGWDIILLISICNCKAHGEPVSTAYRDVQSRKRLAPDSISSYSYSVQMEIDDRMTCGYIFWHCPPRAPCRRIIFIEMQSIKVSCRVKYY